MPDISVSIHSNSFSLQSNTEMKYVSYERLLNTRKGSVYFFLIFFLPAKLNCIQPNLWLHFLVLVRQVASLNLFFFLLFTHKTAVFHLLKYLL